MSALLLPALAAGSSGQGALYVDDVFSTYLYTGNGSSQTINNGIDLAGNGGLVWTKNRSSTGNNVLTDSHRGSNNRLFSNLTAAADAFGATSFLSNGFSLDGGGSDRNTNATTYASWTFRKAPKFFDVVTFATNGLGSGGSTHMLGQSPGMVIFKRTDSPEDWFVWHRTFANSARNYLRLNTVDSLVTAGGDVFSITSASVNVTNMAASATYVAYLFAHDPSAEGVIQCGSFTAATGTNYVNIGWETQYLLCKNVNAAEDWFVFDTQRGMTMTGDAVLKPNLSSSESTFSSSFPVFPTATGFGYTSTFSAPNTYIYLAIRRPNKPPTSGAQVYNSSTASGAVSAGFPVDLHIGATRAGAASNHAMHARLTGGTRELVTSSTAAEATITDLGFDSMAGLKASLPSGMVNHFLRRATGFFDVVCYTGTGVARTVNHNLGAAPELMIIKARSASGTNWSALFDMGSSSYKRLMLNGSEGTSLTGVLYSDGFWLTAKPNSSAVNFGVIGNSENHVNQNGVAYVAYIFATLAGISKVGSYTGNGTSQTIDCGFGTGARFFLVKAVSTTGSWWVYDSARGIVSAADPALQLNSTAAEITSADAVDPTSVGIIVNQEATCSINATGVSYIFLAIA